MSRVYAPVDDSTLELIDRAAKEKALAGLNGLAPL